MVRKEAGEEINWWDEDYFWYGEDLDFCYRLKEIGWKVMFNPKVKITHYRGASSGIIKSSRQVTTATGETKVRAVKASVEAMRIFYRKHYQEKYPPVVYRSVLKAINWLEKVRLYKFSR